MMWKSYSAHGACLTFPISFPNNFLLLSNLIKTLKSPQKYIDKKTRSYVSIQACDTA